MFVASTASGRQIRSSSANSSRFGSSSSTIASITRSQSAKASSSVVSDEPPDGRVARVLLELPLLDLAGQEVGDPVARLLRPARRVTSRPTVSTPASTQSCAIPAPMAPSPTTPTFRISATAAILVEGSRR